MKNKTENKYNLFDKINIEVKQKLVLQNILFDKYLSSNQKNQALCNDTHRTPLKPLKNKKYSNTVTWRHLRQQIGTVCKLYESGFMSAAALSILNTLDVYLLITLQLFYSHFLIQLLFHHILTIVRIFTIMILLL